MAVGFYCTMLSGDKVAWLAGPFDTKEQAQAIVPAARDVACEVDPRSHWDAFGVTKIERASQAPLPKGVLNLKLGL